MQEKTHELPIFIVDEEDLLRSLNSKQGSTMDKTATDARRIEKKEQRERLQTKMRLAERTIWRQLQTGQDPKVLASDAVPAPSGSQSLKDQPEAGPSDSTKSIQDRQTISTSEKLEEAVDILTASYEVACPLKTVLSIVRHPFS